MILEFMQRIYAKKRIKEKRCAATLSLQKMNVYTAEQVAQHHTTHSLWVIVDDKGMDAKAYSQSMISQSFYLIILAAKS